MSTIPTSSRPTVKLVIITTLGLTKASHSLLPLLYKPLYSFGLKFAHEDKAGVEEIAARCAGWEWKSDLGGEKILGSGWTDTEGLPETGSLKNIVIIRPAVFTDGDCQADTKGSAGYRVKESDGLAGYTISRRDVSHFLVEGVLKDWDTWGNKKVDIAY